jgi:hypothetical protein
VISIQRQVVQVEDARFPGFQGKRTDRLQAESADLGKGKLEMIYTRSEPIGAAERGSG